MENSRLVGALSKHHLANQSAYIAYLRKIYYLGATTTAPTATPLNGKPTNPTTRSAKKNDKEIKKKDLYSRKGQRK